MKTKLLSVLGACLALSFAFTGCATTGGGLPPVDPARAQRLAKGAVSIIVVSTVEGDPAKAQKVADDAHLLRTLLGTDGFTTVDLIMGWVQTRIATSNMKPATQIAVALALGEVGEYLRTVVGTGVIPTDKLAKVAEVAGWVEDAAKLVIPPVVAPVTVPPPAATP